MEKESYIGDIQNLCDDLDIDYEGNREKLLQRINDYVFKKEVKLDIQNESIKGIQNKPTTNKINLTKHLGKISEEDLKDDFKKYTWLQMEYLVGRLFESKGYDVEVTKPTGDFGIDVWARNNHETIGIQVKHQKDNVDYPTIAKTVGASIYNEDVKHVIVISVRSGFSKQAMEYQMNFKDKIDLWNSKNFKNQLREYLI